MAQTGARASKANSKITSRPSLSERLGYVGQDSITRSLTINGWLANRSKSISEQRRALLLPQELMQFPTDKLILLRGGIPPIVGTKIAYFSSRFFKSRAFPAPEVSAAPKRTPSTAPTVPFRDMTAEEAAGLETRPMSQDDVLTEDCPSFFADMLTLDHDGNVSGLIEDGDENGG